MAGQTILDELVKDEAFYFRNNASKTSEDKKAWLVARRRDVLAEIDALQSESHITHYLKGCVHNIGHDYNKDAEDILSDAAKMNPTMYEIWNQLGDCIWKKGDKKGARNCFERSLAQMKNKVSLRNLSIVMRQQDNVNKTVIDESVQLSKDAVALDVRDGTSWYILGNAYLAQFFQCGQLSNVLKCSMNAYCKAGEDAKVESDPDYHYNRAIVYKYLDDYCNALLFFNNALEIQPQFPDCVRELGSLREQLLKTHSLIQSKGKFKVKKLNSLLKTLKEKSSRVTPTKLTLSSFNDLSEGVNASTAIHCTLVSSVVPSVQTPFVAVCIDADLTCFAVNLYNIDSVKGPTVGDIITIPYPNKSTIDITIEGQQLLFGLIRVESPLNVMVNGRQSSKVTVAPLQLTTTALS